MNPIETFLSYVLHLLPIEIECALPEITIVNG